VLPLGIVEPSDAQGTGMAGADRSASPIGGGAGGASMGRDVADRHCLAAVFNGHGRGLRAGRRCRGVKRDVPGGLLTSQHPFLDC